MRRLYAVLVMAGLVGGCTAAPPRPSPRRSPAPGPAASGLAWRHLAPAPSARTEVAAAASGTRIHVVGGFRADGTTVTTVEVFDTTTGRWDRGPDLPAAVNHPMAASVGDVVYVFGGHLSDNTQSAAAFRLEAGGWRAVASMPQPRAAGTAVAHDQRVYVAGGVTRGGLASDMLVYDVVGDRWSTVPGPPTRREHLGGAGYGGRVYTVGGRTAGPDTNLGAFEVYDPATGLWSRLPDLPTRRGGLAATATCSGQIVAVGGEETATFAQAESFDVAAGGWRSLPPLPTPRHGLGVVTVGTTVYTLAGGPRPGLHVADSAEAIDLAALGPCR